MTKSAGRHFCHTSGYNGATKSDRQSVPNITGAAAISCFAFRPLSCYPASRALPTEITQPDTYLSGCYTIFIITAYLYQRHQTANHQFPTGKELIVLMITATPVKFLTWNSRHGGKKSAIAGIVQHLHEFKFADLKLRATNDEAVYDEYRYYRSEEGQAQMGENVVVAEARRTCQ